jgi:hypothetical protein
MSSPPVVEIVSFTLKPTLKGDHSLMQGMGDKLIKDSGCKKVYWGVLTEDENAGLLFLGMSLLSFESRNVF